MAGVMVDKDDIVLDDGPRVYKRTKLVKPPEDRWPAPKIHQWRRNLRELMRGNKIMLEDFGIVPQALGGVVKKAKQGDADARARLEPVKQVLFELMGMDQHEREVYDRNNKLVYVEDPMNPGVKVPKTETRSRWGVRGEGRDMYHMAEVGPRPRRAHWKRLVDEHFYDLVTVMEFLRKQIPATQHGRKAPNMDQQIEALKIAQDAATDLQRRDALELIKPFITEGAESAWDGEQ